MAFIKTVFGYPYLKQKHAIIGGTDALYNVVWKTAAATCCHACSIIVGDVQQQMKDLYLFFRACKYVQN
jgi:hypothetical protein